jgi:NADH:ubiquinone reductase (H+-translocating)
VIAPTLEAMKPTRILILGGGFGGVYTALHLDRLLAREAGVEVTLVSAENFLLFTPMLHEVAASALDPSDIVTPLRQMFRRVQHLEAEVQRIDLPSQRVVVTYGPGRRVRVLEYDHLVIATGSEDNFFGNAGLAARAITMKTLTDAMLLRNRVIALLEDAVLETDAEQRRAMLTFVIAGGGFAGVEVIGALNDFVRAALRWYPTIRAEEIRLVLVHPKEVVLPELGEALGRYAQKKLMQRGVEILFSTKVTDYSREHVTLSDGEAIRAATLVWTAGVKPGKLIEDLAVPKENQRLKVNEFLALPETPGVWALGDCASAIDPDTGRPFPTTAQHAVRQGRTVAHNLVAMLRGRPPVAFRFKMLGQLAAIGHRVGVAQVLGVRFSGLPAWFMWRTVYLMKLPRLQKKIQVALHWTADLFFSHDLTQGITVRGLEKAIRVLEEGKATTAGNTSAVTTTDV